MDIDSLKASKKTNQLFLVCVDHYDTSHATFYYYKKEEKWELVLETPALIGQRGLGEEVLFCCGFIIEVVIDYVIVGALHSAVEGEFLQFGFGFAARDNQNCNYKEQEYGFCK